MAVSNPLPASLARRLRTQRAADLAALRDAAGDAFPLARFVAAAPAAAPDATPDATPDAAQGSTLQGKGAMATPAGSWIASRPREAWLTMPADLHAAAMLHAIRHAARGRKVGVLDRKGARVALPDPASLEKGATTVDVALPDPHYVEDVEAAGDAVAFTWNAMRLGKVRGEPLPYLCGVARRFGKRRAQNRLRERTGLTPDPTDRIVPPEMMQLDDEALARATAGTLRASFGHRFVRAATEGERKRAQRRAAQARWRAAGVDAAELEILRARNARPDATDEPPAAARLYEAARDRSTDDEIRAARARAHREWFETMRGAYEADAALRFGPMTMRRD